MSDKALAAAKKLTQIRDKLSRKMEEMSDVKEKLRLTNADLDSKQSQELMIDEKLANAIDELKEIEYVKPVVGLNEDEAMASRLQEVMGGAAELMKLHADQKAEEAANQKKNQVSGPTEVSVHHLEEEAVFRITGNYTFEALNEDVSRFFEVHPSDVMLVDDRGNKWNFDHNVRNEIAKFENPYGRVFLIQKYLKNEEESEESDGEKEDVALLALLGDKNEEEEQANLSSAKKKQINKRKLMREMVSFISFLGLFLMVLVGRRRIDRAFFMVDALTTAFVDEEFGDFNHKAFEDIRTFGEIFEWLTGPFAGGLYPDELYNGDAVTLEQVGYTMMYNKAMGGIRMRQLRVKTDYCTIAKAMERTKIRSTDGTRYQVQFVEHCYAKYNSNSKDEGVPPTYKGDNISDVPGFKYETGKELGERLSHPGWIATYDTGGYARDINPPSKEKMDNAGPQLLDAIEDLKSHLWMDKNTRAIMLSVPFYNGNYNFFCSATFLFEFSPGGTITPSAHMKVVRTDMYDFSRVSQRGPLIAEFFLYMWILYYIYCQHQIYSKLRNMGQKRITYLYDIWNVVECIVLFSFVVSFAVRMAYLMDDGRLKQNIFTKEYQDMRYLAFLYGFSFDLDAICVFFCFFKLFKYFQLKPQMNLLWRVLVKAGPDMGYFMVMMALLMLGFAIIGQQMFGSYLFDYSTTFQSLFRLFLTLLGDIDLPDIRRVAGLTQAGGFFVIYIFLMFFIMVNIFLAILGDAYSMTRQQVEQELMATKSTGVQKRSLKVWIKILRSLWKAKQQERKVRKAEKKKFKAELKKMKNETK